MFWLQQYRVRNTQSIFFIALGRAAAPRENGGGVGLSATSPRCGRASLAVGFSLLSLTLAYACMHLLVVYNSVIYCISQYTFLILISNKIIKTTTEII